MGVEHLTVMTRDGRVDPVGERVRRDVRLALQFDPGPIVTAKVYSFSPALSDAAADYLERIALFDPTEREVAAGCGGAPSTATAFVAVDRRPGVTDDEAQTLRTVLVDAFGEAFASCRTASRDVYWFETSHPEGVLERIARDVVGNPLVHFLTFGCRDEYRAPAITEPSRSRPTIATVPLPRGAVALARLSEERLLALDLAEMQAIADHFVRPATRARRAAAGLASDPTDGELECIAQTWSEHCQHKEFNARISFRDAASGRDAEIDSLFRTYIVAATRAVESQLRAWGQDWLVKVFDDNAGVVRIDAERVFAWKVETHNSPSAVDPYGGAITGILGNNRDPLGTGRGGGRLLFNTDVLCFGWPDDDRPLLPGQLHPRRVFAGVRSGIEDGGNKSGIPTVNGAILFDERFAGKPLVFCGTGSIAPAAVAGAPWWDKRVDDGDRILMVGGRVGKDGIHGATFSSLALGAEAPRSAVQIGSPYTQKLVADFLEDVCARGLVKCATDNGAGGLSSSVGELARLSGGAEIELARVPLKYAGVEPWEILVSESQERMTLGVEEAAVAEVLALAAQYDVEATEIWRFTSDGALRARYEGRPVVDLDLEFLHHGTPRKRLEAEWEPPDLVEPDVPEDLDYGDVLSRMLGSYALCSREPVVRQYDHEIKGRTVVKPLMGRSGEGPQDAAVLRLDWATYRGVAVANGICPRFGDIDPYAMSAAAFDEAVRQIVAVGGRLPRAGAPEPAFWSANDNFCLPNVVFDAVENPDGKRKLGKLVRMCQALYDVAVAYGVPLTSGKDSMKNDFRAAGTTISVPPTVLYSIAAGIPDVRRCVTTDFKAPGDAVYLVGRTEDELGGSEFYRFLGELGRNVPRLRPEAARQRYDRLGEAIAMGLIASCHDISDGGLAVALAECAFGGPLGFDVDLSRVSPADRPHVALFSETTSRFVVSVPRGMESAFEAALGPDAIALGHVSSGGRVRVTMGRRVLVDVETAWLSEAWRRGFEAVL